GHHNGSRDSIPCVHDAGSVYRPRHPERTSLYRLLEAHLEEYLRCHEERFEPRDGPLRPHVRRVVEAYLECGRLHQGFARIRCGNCGEERLLAFSCQTRNVCPSCQAKRAALFGIRLAEEVLAAVPHTHVVFTVPKALRGLFQRDRRLLGTLSQAAYAALREVVQRELGRRDVVPGFVGVVQTFGSFLNWQPHLHGLISEGGFTRDGEFVTLWHLDTDAVEKRFREGVLKRLVGAGRTLRGLADRLRTWSPSGFDVFAGRQMTLGETSRIEEMGRYMVRAPLAQDLPQILHDGTVLIPTPPDPKTGVTELVLDPLEVVHRVVLQIPDPGSHTARYYGAYSCRGRRAQAEPGRASPPPEGDQESQASSDDDAHARQRRRSWAQLLRHIFEVDPLLCGNCGGPMKVLSVLTDPATVERILAHLARSSGPDPPKDDAPRA
ncbi:MAG: IS91 family transposase, partial [Candidatus Methylomirabilales bacterium]